MLKQEEHTLKKTILINTGIVISFLILTFIFMQSFIEINKFNIVSDSSFHLSRANEIYENLKSGSLFTYIATHTFSHSGVGTFLFYPSLFLYILAFLRLIFNPITSIYIWIGIFMFLTLIVAFYSMMSFSKNRKRSYIFSIIYTLIPYHLYLGLWNGVWGEYIAYTFLPLVFLGIYHVLWGDFHKWPILAVGMSLLCYSHIVSVYIATFLCLFLFICKLIVAKITKSRFVSLIKSGCLAILLSGWEFIPFLTDYLGGDIHAPQEQFWFLNNFSDLVTSSFQNVCGGDVLNGRSLGILLIITLFVGWLFVKNDATNLLIYVLGVTLALCSTTFIDWTSLSHNELVMNTIGNIQFPFRLVPYAGLFLSVIASFVICNIIDGITSSNYKQILVIISFVLISVCGYFGTVQPALDRITQNVSEKYLKKTESKQTIPDDVVIDKYNYNAIFDYLTQTGETDYYSEKAYNSATSIINNIVYVNGKESKLIAEYKPNKIIYMIHAQKGDKIDLPVIAYKHTSVSDDGKKVKFNQSKRGTVEILARTNVNRIEVSYKPIVLYYVMMFIALLSWVGVIFYQVKNVKNRLIY